MVNYSLAQNRTADDMDGIGTDLVTGDTVVTNAFSLTLDIDCGWQKITVSNNGTLVVEGNVYEIDDSDGAGIEAEAGSDVTPSGLSPTNPAIFKSAVGEGNTPLYPWSFSVIGTMDLAYCLCFGNKWSMRNTNYNLELPLGCAKILKGIVANIAQNSIQGYDAELKFLGRKSDVVTLTALLFDGNQHIVDLLTAMEASGELFSLVGDRFFAQAVMIRSLNFRNEGKDLVLASVGISVQGG